MTCIVGVKGSDGVLLVGDRQSTRGWGLKYDQGEKLCNKGETVVFGAAGGIREHQVVRYHVDDVGVGQWDELEWAVKTFVPAVRTALKDQGCLTKETEGPERYGGEFMLGVRGRLFQFYGDFSLRECDDYGASGSGEEVAIAYLATCDFHDSDGKRLTCKELLPIATAAVRASADLNAGVGMEVTHVTTKLWTKDEIKWAEKVLAA